MGMSRQEDNDMPYMVEVRHLYKNFIDEGRIIEEGDPEELFAHPTTERGQKFLQTFSF